MASGIKMDFVSFLLCVLCFVSILVNPASSSCTTCLRSGQCLPPDCFCCRGELGLQMPASDTPQIVFFTFDDALTDQAAKFYNRLFNNSRLNPNGCPVSMTMFISHTDTQYNHVTEFHRRGMEIAAHSVTHAHMTPQNFYTEAQNQKRNLAKYGKFPESDIVGWRSPFLEPLGDLQPEQLKQLGYIYDATLTFSKRKLNDSAPTPFTLDFGWPYDCKVKPCPRGRHTGFWEVPVVSLLDYLHQYDCVYVDGCMNIPPNEDLAYQFLMDNFNSYYQREKIPFGINMHPSWFYTTERLNAMDRFIMELVSRNDVFIVSVKKTLDWLKDPTRLSRINSFQPWQCKSSTDHFHSHSHSHSHMQQPSAFGRMSDSGRRNFQQQQQPAPPSLFEARRVKQQSMEQQRDELRRQRQNVVTQQQESDRRISNGNDQRSWTMRSPYLPGTPLRSFNLPRTPQRSTHLPETPSLQARDIEAPPQIPSSLKPRDNTQLLSQAFGQVFWRQTPRERALANQEVPSRRHSSRKWGRTRIPSTRQRRPVQETPQFEFQTRQQTFSPGQVQTQLQKFNQSSPQLDRQLGLQDNGQAQTFNIPNPPTRIRNRNINDHQDARSEINVRSRVEIPPPFVNGRDTMPGPTTMSIYDQMEQRIIREQNRKKSEKQRLVNQKIRLENKKQETEKFNIDAVQQRRLEQQMQVELENRRRSDNDRKNRERQTRKEHLQMRLENRRRKLVELRNKKRGRQSSQRQVSHSNSRISVSPRRSGGNSPPRRSGENSPPRRSEGNISRGSTGNSSTRRSERNGARGSRGNIPRRSVKNDNNSRGGSGKIKIDSQLETQWNRFINLLMGR